MTDQPRNLTELKAAMEAIEERDRCSPSCSPGCAGCTPDGFWANVASDQLALAMQFIESRWGLVEVES